MEYAQNVLGIHDAQHQEINPGAPDPFISQLACSLAGQTQTVRITPGSQAYRFYGRGTSVESFNCGYGLNEAFHEKFNQGPLEVGGVDDNGLFRIVELPGHRFFMATLFLPQLTSTPDRPHPLIAAFLNAAIAFRKEKDSGSVDREA